MSTCLHLSAKPLRSVRHGPRPARAVMVRADKETALQQLRDSQATLAARLSKVESEVKRANSVVTSAASASASQVLTAEPTEGGLEEIDQFNYYDKIKAAETPVVVVDFYTEWCGPCKLMYPRLVEMKRDLAGQVTFYKFNCSKKNKELGVTLGVKVAPTFFVYKDGEKASSMTGAKIDELRAMITAAL